MARTRRRFLTLTGGVAAGLFAPRLLSLGTAPAGAQQAAGGAALTGSTTNATLGPVALNAGLVVLRTAFAGTGHFAASLVSAQAAGGGPGSGGFVDLFNQNGAFKGAAATLVGAQGNYYVQVNSEGACQIGFEQPRPETVSPVAQTSFAGRGPDVSPYFLVTTGVSSLSVQTGSTTLRAWLYHLDDQGGQAVAGGVNTYDGRFFDLTAPGSQTSYGVSLPDRGPYLLAVGNIATTDTWALAFA